MPRLMQSSASAVQEEVETRTRSLRERDEAEREAGEVKRQLEEDADREIEELQDKCACAGAPSLLATSSWHAHQAAACVPSLVIHQ